MRVLILGSGGREHALGAKIKKSKKLQKLFIAPGNAGTALCGENVDLNILDFEEVANFAMDQNITTIVVGPEAPLVGGIYNYFKERDALKHISLIAPSKEGAKLEGSKDFAKNFMRKNDIPTAKYFTVTRDNLERGNNFIDKLKSPYVLKADGLAGGKGVMILLDIVAAKNMLSEMLRGKFGESSNKVVIEEYLDGIEVSIFVLTDGKNYKILPEAKDYKRIGDNDQGLNTGGMGAVSPVPFVTPEFLEKVRTKIIEPTISGLQKENITYKGFIFIGLMNCGGEPKVIEYNVRMGDPETEVVIPRLDADLLDLFEGVEEGNLNTRKCAIINKTALSVVVASGGYPNEYEIGFPISGLEDVEESFVFHAGTTLSNNKVCSNSGRVLVVTSLAKNIDQAREKSYKALSKISFNKMYFRKDIGLDLKKL